MEIEDPRPPPFPRRDDTKETEMQISRRKEKERGKEQWQKAPAARSDAHDQPLSLYDDPEKIVKWIQDIHGGPRVKM